MTRRAGPNLVCAVVNQITPAPKAGLILALLISLTACGGSGGTSPDSNATHPSANALTISSLAPDSGPTSGSTPVAITGAHFQSGASVTFGGVAATSVNLVSSTQLTAVTPKGNAGAVAVAVMNPGGESAALTDGFTYTVPSSDSIQIIRSLTDGNPHVPYHATLVAYGGVQSLSNIVSMSNWTITSGSLPSGLALSPAGVISGTPAAAGTSAFTVQATSASGILKSLSLSLSVVTPSASGPALPQAFLDTTYPDTAGYVVKTVCTAGCDYTTVQKAVSSVHDVGGDASGEIIKLASGETFTENVTLPAYTMVPGKWVIITTNTDSSNLPAEGKRIEPSYSPVLAKIVTNNSGYAVGAASQANHYWLMGLEIEALSGLATNYGIVVIGCASGACETSAANLPSYIYVDRCYIHGNSLSSNISRGVSANGADIAVVNSYISAITNTQQDSQAVAAWNGPGPLKVVNNHLEAAGENFLLGGADPSISNLVTQDVEVRRNEFFKPLTWYKNSSTFGGVVEDVKNSFELKNANRVLVEGNVLENDWVANQSGVPVLFTPRNSGGACPWCVVSNVTFKYNLIEHATGIFDLSGGDTDAGHSLPASYITFANNLAMDITGTFWGGSEPAYKIVNSAPPPANIVIDHNTIQSPNLYSVAFFGDSYNTNYVTPFIFTNNVQPHGEYGIGGSNAGEGTAGLNAYCGPGGYTVTANVLENASGNPGGYPNGNFFPKDWSTVFVNYDQGDYHILPSGPYNNAGTDGKDLGADIDALVSAIAGNEW